MVIRTTFKFSRNIHTRMAQPNSLVVPMKRLLTPRPAIQAWRSARCFATQLTSNGSDIPPLPISMEAATSSTTFSVRSSLPSASSNDELPTIEQNTTTSQSDADGAPKSRPLPVGVVVSAGKMAKTVKVRIPGQTWNKYLRKVSSTNSLGPASAGRPAPPFLHNQNSQTHTTRFPCHERPTQILTTK